MRHEWSDIIPAAPRRRLLALWLLLAALNLAAGVVTSRQPGRDADFETMHRWAGSWLVGRANAYETDEDPPDYPPHALVALSPVGALPLKQAVVLWTLANLILAPVTAFCAVRAARPDAPAWAALLPTLMFLCWGNFRTMLQFSRVSLTCGLLSIVFGGSRPGVSGILLGMSLIKPQMAAPFFLLAVFTRQKRRVVIALSVVAAGAAIYCLRVGYSPVDLAARYLQILRLLYSGSGRATILLGIAQIRPLLMLSIASIPMVDITAAALAALLLAAIWRVAVRERRDGTLIFSAPSLVGIWSLMTFYHLSYGFSLLLPTATLLLFLNDPRTVQYRRRLFWALQLAMMFDVVTIWRRFGPLLGVAAGAGPYIVHVDRVLVLALFGSMLRLYVKTAARGPAAA